MVLENCNYVTLSNIMRNCDNNIHPDLLIDTCFNNACERNDTDTIIILSTLFAGAFSEKYRDQQNPDIYKFRITSKNSYSEAVYEGLRMVCERDNVYIVKHILDHNIDKNFVRPYGGIVTFSEEVSDLLMNHYYDN